MPGRGGPGMLGGGGIMAPPGGGAENGVGGIFPCWNAAATLGGKKKEKKRERIPEEKIVTKRRKLLCQRSFSCQAFRTYLTSWCTLICSYSGTNPWFTLLVKMEAPDILEDSYYSNYSS